MANFCWQQDTLEVDIKDSDVTGKVLKQTGYSMVYESSHDFEIEVSF